MSNFMQINRVCEFFLDQTNSSNLPAFPLMSYPGPPGSPRHRFFHGSLPDPTWLSRSSCILTRLFPEFTQMFLHTLLETRDFDLLSTLETLLDLRYRPRSVTILPGKMLVTTLIIKITISYFPLRARLHGAEISARLLKQILRKPSCRLHGERFSPGRNSARAENPSPVFSNRARIFSPAKRAEKSM